MPQSQPGDPRPGPLRVVLLYWGRRGALSRFALDLQKAARGFDDAEVTLSVSSANELFASFRASDAELLAVDTFRTSAQAILKLPQAYRLRKHVTDWLIGHKIDAVVVLLSHVWTPIVAPAIKRAGMRYVVVVHDARMHPGDVTGLVGRWLRQDLKYADLVVTLTRSVAAQLRASGNGGAGKLVTLFHPVLRYASDAVPRRRRPGTPLRLLFFGRIMRYKGLGLLVDALQRLQRSDVHFQLGVFGEGNIGEALPGLRRIGAEVVNRWLGESEIEDVLARHDAVVLSHIEASQSGVAAVALGAGLPVIATPVGGLVEQIEDGVNGVLAAAADPASLATAIERLATDVDLYNRIAANIVGFNERQSVDRFLHALIEEVRVI